jgi:putative N-acetylmannosamine-6-phosphate epimerase
VSTSRFSQAISEGDGISVIPVLEGEVEVLAEAAEAVGAEAVAVDARDVERVRARTTLPIIAR